MPNQISSQCFHLYDHDHIIMHDLECYAERPVICSPTTEVKLSVTRQVYSCMSLDSMLTILITCTVGAWQRLLDNSLFGQLALGQLAIWSIRYVDNSLSGQLAIVGMTFPNDPFT
jgi:hypothetical protein